MDRKLKYKNLARQAGLTLIELTVVLLVLVGLAGLMLPYIGNFMSTTHNSTTAASLSELNNTIQRYQTQTWKLPDYVDSLAGTDGALYSKLQNNSFLTVNSLTTGQVTALNNAGVTTMYAMQPTAATGYDATFGAQAGAVSLAAGSNAAFLTGNTASSSGYFYGQLDSTLATGNNVKDQLIYAFGGNGTSWDSNCTQYIVVGIGTGNSMVPSAMSNVPVHFAGTAAQAADVAYDRYVAVYSIPSNTAVMGTTKYNGGASNGQLCSGAQGASFVGAAMVMPFPAIVGTQGSLEWTNENQNDS
jgi:type II secretory pathway pseudopilin PulG